MTKYVSNDLRFSKQNFLNEFNFLWKLLLVYEKDIIKVYWKILKPGREYSRMDEVERVRERERVSGGARADVVVVVVVVASAIIVPSPASSLIALLRCSSCLLI